MKTLSATNAFIIPMSAEQSSKAADGQNKWKCEICGRSFDNVDMLNYHNLLEHSEHKRPPIGIG